MLKVGILATEFCDLAPKVGSQPTLVALLLPPKTGFTPFFFHWWRCSNNCDGGWTQDSSLAPRTIHTHVITLSTPCDPGLVLTTFTCASAFAAVFPAAISAPACRLPVAHSCCAALQSLPRSLPRVKSCPLSHLFRAACWSDIGVDRFVKATGHNEQTKR